MSDQDKTLPPDVSRSSLRVCLGQDGLGPAVVGEAAEETADLPLDEIVGILRVDDAALVKAGYVDRRR